MLQKLYLFQAWPQPIWTPDLRTPFFSKEDFLNINRTNTIRRVQITSGPANKTSTTIEVDVEYFEPKSIAAGNSNGSLLGNRFSKVVQSRYSKENRNNSNRKLLSEKFELYIKHANLCRTENSLQENDKILPMMAATARDLLAVQAMN